MNEITTLGEQLLLDCGTDQKNDLHSDQNLNNSSAQQLDSDQNNNLQSSNLNPSMDTQNNTPQSSNNGLQPSTSDPKKKPHVPTPQLNLNQHKLALQKAQLDFDKRQFASEKAQFESQFALEKSQQLFLLEQGQKQFELDKTTFHHDLQQQRLVLREGEVEAKALRAALEEERREISGLKKHILGQKRAFLIEKKNFFVAMNEIFLTQQTFPYKATIPQFEALCDVTSSNNGIIGNNAVAARDERGEGDDDDDENDDENFLDSKKSDSLLVQYPLPSDNSSLFIDTVNIMIKQCDDRRVATINHYKSLLKQLKQMSGGLRKREEGIVEREKEAQDILSQNKRIRSILKLYLVFMAQRHHYIMNVLARAGRLTERNGGGVGKEGDKDNNNNNNNTNTNNIEAAKRTKYTKNTKSQNTKTSQNTTTKMSQTSQAYRSRMKMIKKAGLTKKNSMFRPNYTRWEHTPALEQEILKNKLKWDNIVVQQKVDFSYQMAQYSSKKVQILKNCENLVKTEEIKVPRTDGGSVQPSIMFKLTNINKNIHLLCNLSVSTHPLIAHLYRIPDSTLLPIFNHFFKRDYEKGSIPKLNEGLKLFFSSKNIEKGRWIQFHGPGKELDGAKWDNPITLSGLLNPFSQRLVVSQSNHDRCEMEDVLCRKQHNTNNDHNYDYYHSSPLNDYSSQYEIAIKWE